MKMYFATFRLFSFFLCLFVFSLEAQARGTEYDYGKVAELINQRLSYMRDVASYKAEKSLPIEDMEQEKKVLASSVKEAELFGLSEDSVKPFVKTLMASAKAIQYRYRADWLSIERNEKSQPLVEIRTKLNVLNKEIFREIAAELRLRGYKDDFNKSIRSENENGKRLFMAQISQDNLKETDKEKLYSALQQIQLKPGDDGAR